MKVLFIGGTGIISREASLLAASRGVELFLLNRGQRRPGDLPESIRILQGDYHGPIEALRAVIDGHRFDAVVNFIAYKTQDIERDLALFDGRQGNRCGQYVFISSASIYQKPVGHYLITESTPTVNPYWPYSQDKIACEEALMHAYRTSGFPVTIVRPSLTYDRTMIPHIYASWSRPWTIAQRILDRRPVVAPGDGSSLWVVTHARDFAKGLVGLLGNHQALGHAFHITTDEVHTWNSIYQTLGAVLGVEPIIRHITTDDIVAHDPSSEGSLRGDKIWSVVFDNSKIKRFVPGYTATISLRAGIEESVAWFRADPSRQLIDEVADQKLDSLIARYA